LFWEQNRQIEAIRDKLISGLTSVTLLRYLKYPVLSTKRRFASRGRVTPKKMGELISCQDKIQTVQSNSHCLGQNGLAAPKECYNDRVS